MVRQPTPGGLREQAVERLLQRPCAASNAGVWRSITGSNEPTSPGSGGRSTRSARSIGTSPSDYDYAAHMGPTECKGHLALREGERVACRHCSGRDDRRRASPNSFCAASALREGSIWKETASLLTETARRGSSGLPREARAMGLVAWRSAGWCARIGSSASGSNSGTNRFRLSSRVGGHPRGNAVHGAEAGTVLEQEAPEAGPVEPCRGTGGADTSMGDDAHSQVRRQRGRRITRLWALISISTWWIPRRRSAHRAVRDARGGGLCSSVRSSARAAGCGRGRARRAGPACVPSPACPAARSCRRAPSTAPPRSRKKCLDPVPRRLRALVGLRDSTWVRFGARCLSERTLGRQAHQDD